jgi:hypothetical protein
MSFGKQYGQDGPPQLNGRTEDVPSELLGDWIAAGGDSVWTFRDPEWWRKRIVCVCGSNEAFEVLSADARTPGWIKGKYGGHQRCDLHCTHCGKRFLLFDDGVHGYNAVVCDERAELPQGYLQRNGLLLRQLTCGCGGSAFSIIAEAMYDCADAVEDLPESQWDDAYGSFGATARCSKCGRVQNIAEAETA